jgi:hypothetical protein
MPWEAYRWTAKTPAELHHTLGPQGVDHLVRQMLDACWRESPAEGRSLASVRKIAQEVFDRNMSVWAKIKKPSPAAFFESLLPAAADGFLRQAMVLCWMMLPRSGGRHVADVRQIIAQIYNRNIAAWEEDQATFSGRKKPAKARSAKMRTAKPKTAAKRSSKAASAKRKK